LKNHTKKQNLVADYIGKDENISHYKSISI